VQLHVITRTKNGTLLREMRRSTLANNSFDFTYLEEVSSVSPNTTYADGDNLTVSGSGFTQMDGIYTCVLQSRENSTRTSFTPANPINPNTLLCKGVFWSHKAERVSLRVERTQQDGTRVVVPSAGAVNVTVTEAWTSANESTVASAALVVVKGGGFDVNADPSVYTCHFAVEGVFKNVTATFVDSYTMLCDGGQWQGPAGHGTLSFRRSNVPNTPPAKAGVAVLSAKFLLKDSVVGIDGSANGSALGNTTILFKGNSRCLQQRAEFC
jgi:hypothetical protein